jgi:hypothetical protein
MADPRSGTSFPPKSLLGGLICVLGTDGFERNAPVQPFIVGLVNDPHATFAQLAENSVVSDSIQTTISWSR